jgi:hypothetical protein
LKLYRTAYLVLRDIATARGSGTTSSTRAKAAGAVKSLMSFDFVLIMHVMKELMGITDLLCKKLQQKSQDIVNAMDDVATTKKLIQNLRDHGWSSLISVVTSFCNKHGIVAPDMNVLYPDFIQSHANDQLTVEHHYKYYIFTIAVDQQLHELNCRFSEQATKLLILCTTLDPKDSFKSLKIDDVCLLASKFYTVDFSEQERNILRNQLQHYVLDVPSNPKFKISSTIVELCHRLVETGKSEEYYLIDRLCTILTLVVYYIFHYFNMQMQVLIVFLSRLIRLVLTLPISTATKEIAIKFTTDALIDDFYEMETRRVRLK